MNIKKLKKAELVNLVMELQEENARLKGAINNLFELANGTTTKEEVVVKEPVKDFVYLDENVIPFDDDEEDDKYKFETYKQRCARLGIEYRLIDDTDIPF